MSYGRTLIGNKEREGEAYDVRRLREDKLVMLIDCTVDFYHKVRRQLGDDALIIVRWWIDNWSKDCDPKAFATQWFNTYRDNIRSMAHYNTIFQGPNEVPDKYAAWYCTEEIERMRLMHAGGWNSCIGNFSVGCPDFPVWATYRPMLDAMYAGDYLGLHEYWWNRNSMSFNWLVGRFDTVPELQGVNVVITECGRDEITLKDGKHGQPGWRLSCNDDEFYGDLQVYAEILKKGCADAIVFGGTNWDNYTAPAVMPEFDPSDYEEPVMYDIGRFLSHPESWEVSREFGYQDPGYTDGYHKGTDLVHEADGTEGALLYVPYGVGEVIVDVVYYRPDRGWYVFLFSEKLGIELFFCHLMMEPNISVGDVLHPGECVGFVGKTGEWQGKEYEPHLHFGICEVENNPPYYTIKRWLDPCGPEVDQSWRS